MMSKKTKKCSHGGAKRLSTRAKRTKKKLAAIKRAEKLVEKKQKKLGTAKSKVFKAEMVVNKLMENLNWVNSKIYLMKTGKPKFK